MENLTFWNVWYSDSRKQTRNRRDFMVCKSIEDLACSVTLMKSLGFRVMSINQA